MRFISHRGNLNGRVPERENTVPFVEEALEQGFDVEVDLWILDDHQYFLGHDSPEHPIHAEWLRKNHEVLWIHAKSIETAEILYRMNSDFHWFWHQEDSMTQTSRGFLWTYPGVHIENCITVQLDFFPLPRNILGVCSDYPQQYKQFFTW
jgi:hypothetical protein